VKLVSVLTTGSSGGAEFAAFELLDAVVARGHDAVVLTNLTELKRETQVAVRPVNLGPKLSTKNGMSSRTTYFSCTSRRSSC
jgi:hypothetical protein